MNCLDFIKDRKDSWLALEENLKKVGRGRERMKSSVLLEFIHNYRKVSADLSLSRTLFPKDPINNYLNNLVIRSLSLIAVQKDSDWVRVKTFFYESLPMLVIRIKNLFFLSCIAFCLSILFGFLLSWLNPLSANAIMGDQYIYMTLKNIQKGDPFAVYKGGFQFFTSSFIMANNIKVAFLAFAAGVLYGVGTIYILIMNGLMLGSLLGVFYYHYLLWESITTIMIHGTLELFAIMVAGAGGLRLGQSLFKPGNLKRLDALYIFGMEAVQAITVMVPIFVIAGLLEGYITPMDLNVWKRLIFIGGSVILLYFYLVFPTQLYIKRKRKLGETIEPSLKIRF